jgi:nucleolar protein 12
VNVASSSKASVQTTATVRGVVKESAEDLEDEVESEDEADGEEKSEESTSAEAEDSNAESGADEEGYLSAGAELSEGEESLDEGEDTDADPGLPTTVHSPENDSDTDDEDGEASLSNITHESLKPAASKPKPSSSRYVPPNETSSDRNRRTIFLGNLPISLTKTKTQQSQLRAHLLTYAPTAKIESIRFRSIPFAKPTAGLGEEGDEEGKRLKREKERARVWREGQEVLKGGDEKAKEEVDKSKSYIDSKGKRKVAFIKKEVG